MNNQPPTLDQLRELSARLGQQLQQHQLTIALAESCTGGLIASILTDIAGSSHYVMGGVVSYSNFAKMHVLGVKSETLEAHGAVSPETAAEMAQGVRGLLQTDLAVSVTGIAGPGGGTPEKPVGLVYLHLSAKDAEWGEMHVWPYDRIGNKHASVAAGLNLALRYINERLADAGPAQPASDAGETLPTVLVEAAWREGVWQPRAVWLQGRRKQVVGMGRQEQTAAGVWLMTVEFGDGGRAELVADAEAGVWRLRRYWPKRRAV
jgi:PncC family amidohydrolase